MKCLMKYQWVKLPRDHVPPGKGIMGAWVKLASRAAFRNGQASYCGYTNHVTIGTWAGGIVGLKSILGIRDRKKALEMMDTLASLEYIDYSLDPKTKKLVYRIKDWVVNCSGAPCNGQEAVYATPGYGFLCLPRNITERLVKAHYRFDESDAWLDLWCHSVWQEADNAFSHMAPTVQFGRYGAVLTLESLGQRWGWEKTKVWRFFKKHADAFPLLKLPGSFGCLIFNSGYPSGVPFSMPAADEIVRIFNQIRILGKNTHFEASTDHRQMSKFVAWFSKRLVPPKADSTIRPQAVRRVAVSQCYITRAYFSPCENCWSFREDCTGKERDSAASFDFFPRAGPEAGPSINFGGIEYGRFEGDPLW